MGKPKNGTYTHPLRIDKKLDYMIRKKSEISNMGYREASRILAEDFIKWLEKNSKKIKKELY